VDEVAAMGRQAEELGVRFKFDTVISPRIDGGKKPLAQRLSPVEAARLDVEERATGEQWSDYCSSQLESTIDAERHYRCGAGSATFLIDPYGRLHVCELSRQPNWDVLAHGFARGWYEEVPRLVASKAAAPTPCHTCPTESLCSNCVGMSELEGTALNPYLCQLTDERNRMILGAQRPLPAGLIALKTRAPHEAGEPR
jgi:radical SAM protein with 4Fe4S-binding SPASM domain